MVRTFLDIASCCNTRDSPSSLPKWFAAVFFSSFFFYFVLIKLMFFSVFCFLLSCVHHMYYMCIVVDNDTVSIFFFILGSSRITAACFIHATKYHSDRDLLCPHFLSVASSPPRFERLPTKGSALCSAPASAAQSRHL